MSIRTTTAFATGAVVAVVLAGGTTYAATGGNFILGRSNTAGTYSTLTNSNGTALVVRSKAGEPSLRVNTTAKVPSLNADRVDSIEGSSLVRTSTQLGTITSPGFVDDNGTTDESDDVLVAEALCPEGAQVMGGGAYDGTDGIPYQSSPIDGAEGWVVASTGTPTEENAALVEAFARCWNPSGNVTDDFARKAARELSPSAKRQIAGAPRDK